MSRCLYDLLERAITLTFATAIVAVIVAIFAIPFLFILDLFETLFCR